MSWAKDADAVIVTDSGLVPVQNAMLETRYSPRRAARKQHVREIKAGDKEDNCSHPE